MKPRLALAVIAAYALMALIGPMIIGTAGLAVDLEHELAAASLVGRLGRAENGVDVLTALIHGARVSFFVALLSTFISAVVGISVGSATAMAGGKTDALVMRCLDVLLAFPGILLAIYLAGILPPSPLSVVVALSVTGWVGFARVMRSSVLVSKSLEHVTAARSLGAGHWRVFLKHILPVSVTPVIVQTSFALSSAILAEASLSFLGLGAQAGTPSWGGLLDEGVAYLFVAPHLAIAPGVCIAATVLAFNVLGDALRDALDVRSVKEGA